MADEFVTKASFVKIDMTEPGSKVPEKYDILQIPATAIFKDGILTTTILEPDADAIRTAIKKVL